MSSADKPYRISTPGLAEAVANCAPAADHAALVNTIRSFPGWESAKLVTERDGMTLPARKVLDSNGKLVAEDHRAWLKARVDANGGNVAATRRQLAGEGYLLTETELTSLFVVCDRGGARADDFVQMVVWVQNKLVDRELFAGFVGYLEPEDARDLLFELGEPLAHRESYRPASYAVDQAIDVARFVNELVVWDRSAQERAGKRIVSLRHGDGTEHTGPLAELIPKSVRSAPPGGKRLFDEWLMSSAGRSGARICDHWVLVQAHDRTDEKGERHMGLVPGWTFGGKLAEIKKASSDYDLMGKLEKLDARAACPSAGTSTCCTAIGCTTGPAGRCWTQPRRAALCYQSMTTGS